MIGETLGSYRISEQIGQGGMGEVYLAKHSVMDRMAAIKVLRPKYSAEADLVARFFSEARAANLVKHPGIVEIYDCAVHTDGRAYIAMEYLEGQTLGAALERLGCVDDVGTLVDIAWQVATALQAAHNKGIVHRDLKPDNIFLAFVPDQGPGMVVKVLDFGVAKLLHAHTKATQTGSLLGTPLYMSPEQGRGSGTIDHRTDIYALGCIMFEMITGRTPFVREGMGDLIIAHASEIPPLASKIKPRIPPELDQLIARMLAKRPEDRPQSMQEVIAVLEMFRIHKSAMAATAPYLSDLDEGVTTQFQGAAALVAAPVIAAPIPVATPPRRQVAPTEILPPSEREDISPRSVVQAPMVPEHSWIARVQRAAYEKRPKHRDVVYERPARPSPPSQTPAPDPLVHERPSRSERQSPSTRTRSPEASRRSTAVDWIRPIALGLLGGAAILAILWLVLSRAKPNPELTAAAAAPAVALPAPPPAPVALPPLAQAAPSAPSPPPAASAPSPTQAVVAPTTAPAKTKRPAHHPAAAPITGLGAEALDAGFQSFKRGDYISAGIEAKRAARQGAGTRAFLLLGDSMMHLQSYAEAQQAYQSAIELEPGSAKARLGLRQAKQKAPR